jgi:hypothetical protein
MARRSPPPKARRVPEIVVLMGRMPGDLPRIGGRVLDSSRATFDGTAEALPRNGGFSGRLALAMRLLRCLADANATDGRTSVVFRNLSWVNLATSRKRPLCRSGRRASRRNATEGVPYRK